MNIKGISFALTGTLMLAATLSANAALAPNYQRASELGQIIDLVAEQFPQHAIDQIVHEGENIYRVVYGPCTVMAEIVPEDAKPMIVGPLQFSVKFGDPVCTQ